MESGSGLAFQKTPFMFTTCISGLSEDVELAFKDLPKFMTIDLDQMIKAFDSLEAHVASIHQSSEQFSSPLAHFALTGASTVFVMVMVTVRVVDLVTVLKAVAVVNSVFVTSLVTVL